MDCAVTLHAAEGAALFRSARLEKLPESEKTQDEQDDDDQADDVNDAVHENSFYVG